MKKGDDVVYLKHILDAMEKIDKYIFDFNKTRFLKTPIVQDAVIRQIEIIGEATKNVSAGLKMKYTDVPWKDMAGMRDKLIHGYFGVDIKAVWSTAKNDIPVLRLSIKKIIENES